jgi:hypothetical protein
VRDETRGKTLTCGTFSKNCPLLARFYRAVMHP